MTIKYQQHIGRKSDLDYDVLVEARLPWLLHTKSELGPCGCTPVKSSAREAKELRHDTDTDTVRSASRCAIARHWNAISGQQLPIRWLKSSTPIYTEK